MSRVIYTYKHYVVLDTFEGLVLKNSKGKKNNHAHFNRRKDREGNINLDTVKTCIRLCDSKRTDIKSKYIFEAVIRLTTDKDYKNNLERLYKKKFTRDRYINVNRGVRK